MLVADGDESEKADCFLCGCLSNCFVCLFVGFVVFALVQLGYFILFSNEGERWKYELIIPCRWLRGGVASNVRNEH